MSESFNEEGYTLQDIDNCIEYVFDAPMPSNYADIIIEALEFYKETNYIG